MIKNRVIKYTLVLLLIFALGLGIFFYRTQKSNEATQYHEVLVSRSDIVLSVLSSGTVQPQNRLEIKPPVAGRIEQVLVNEGAKVKKGQILAWMSSTERAALLDAARSQGLEEVKKWEELYKPTPILAPLTGVLILKNVEPGQTFTSTDAVFVLSDRLTVKAQVDETDISQVKVKQKAEISLDAYPNQKIQAIVDQIAFEAKTVSNVTTYIVDVVPSDTPDFMRSGMTANIKFFIQSRSQVIVIPTEAIKLKDNKKFVLIKNLNSKQVEERFVETGLLEGKSQEIISGLSDGEILLVADVKIPTANEKKPSNAFGMPSMPRGGSRGSQSGSQGAGNSRGGTPSPSAPPASSTSAPNR